MPLVVGAVLGGPYKPIEVAGSARLTDVLSYRKDAKGRPIDRALVEVIKGRGSAGLGYANEYVAAKVAEDALLKIAGQKKEGDTVPPSKGPVVIGNIEEDFHSLGRRMLGIFLASDGWIVHDLGNDVPAAEFVDKAVAVGARVIGVSAMMLTTALNIKQLRTELDKRGLSGRIQLAVGGAVFLVRPGLDHEVGGDGTARTALEATALFTRLWQASSEKEVAP
ncbi:MAG: corrinoid-binding protein [Desulfobulbaceae bacterium]|nr:corrinoid-binding protein [Desulfobulbaceae bacterium]